MKEQILKILNNKEIGRHIYFYGQIGSTNSEARVLAEQGAVHGSLVLAGQQTDGKGRRGRSWAPMKDAGIAMSLLLRPQILPVNASMLTLVAALAVSDAIKMSGLFCTIKWPNDIIIGNKKVCGILTEMSADMERVKYVVVGMGINVNTKSFPMELEETATSMFLEGGSVYSREQTIKNILEAFEKYYHIFIKTEDLSGLMKIYNQRLINMGRSVRVIERTDDFIGISEGINSKGELIVCSNGQRKTIVSGEVSVRGIFGYV